MANLAIKGHSTRGKEVIQLLEMLGGENKYNLEGTVDSYCYYIDDSNKICSCSSVYVENVIVFTLEEFEEKFPYKVGDKVIVWIDGYRSICNIQNMEWDGIANEIKYKIQDYWYSTINLQPYIEENYCQVIGNDTSSNGVNTSASSIEEETMEEKEPEPKAPILSNRYDYAEGKCGYVIPDGYEFDYIKEGFQTEIILKPKKPTYPKDYKECCEVLGYSGNYNMILTTDIDCKLFNALYRLKVCRDAYWKIAGEQLGLDEPWKPDWNNLSATRVYIKINKGCLTYASRVFVFPTEEMRDAFYENFKGLIEQCKELL